MPAGTREKLHFHTHAQQFFFILKGTATFYLDNEKLSVAEQKGLQIRPKAKHYIANETNERLDFLVISQPTTNYDRTNIQQTDNDKKFQIIMNNSDTHNQRIAKMTFASVYPLYLAKVEKKGRTKEELNQVIKWLTGFDNKKQQELINENATFETFFQRASLNPNAYLITGVICGYRVEEIENPLTQQIRYLDKLVDELAKGRKMEKILRSS